MATYVRGTAATVLVQWQEYPGGPAVNVSNLTVTITRVAGSVVVVGPTSVGITNLATGLYSFVWNIPSAEVTGDYVIVWNAIDAALEPVQTSELATVAAISSSQPCAWNITVTDDCCPDWSTLPTAQQERALRLATQVMWAATGRRYGVCSTVVRPCGTDRKCGSCGGLYFHGGWMRPYILDGVWRNCGCGCPCDCKPHCQIKLPGPVDNVSEVLIDGVILSDSSWRVDDFQWLVRTDGECWPQCQDYDVDVPAAGTLQVTYGRGEPVPLAVLDAAAILACEFAKACAGNDGCRLPGRLQTLTRQGVTVSMVDIDRMLVNSLTGLPEVDMIIMSDNPYGHKKRPFFSSYDTDPRVRVVTQN